MGLKLRDVEGDDPDWDGDSLGSGEIGRSRFGWCSAVTAGDLAGRAASLLGRARMVVRRRRQAEERHEGDEDDGRSARTEHGVERST